MTVYWSSDDGSVWKCIFTRCWVGDGVVVRSSDAFFLSDDGNN